ncbi:hypothetical protein SAMN05443429_108113 [Cruoricaptor ignavus]|uniref:Winged helix-turn-helix DNA-binding n=1 Tax=Cruoricaptor ignavus TaxID=1118202 RepID=A0A1M6GAB5_9FLAO|nr:hypothetical protein [Cruoricaptor ignavus]SHJ06814.1 hypothetical protein SAMN05443429_108113 [Cruoricaptor ignavus]
MKRITSKLAHNAIKPDKATMHRMIMQGLNDIIKGTSRQIAVAANLPHDKVWKRLSELERLGKISHTGLMMRDVESGRLCGVWKINENF